jgi:hypothetical protein
VADPCRLLGLSSDLRLRLLALGFARIAVDVCVDRPWRASDLTEAARLDLGLL